jgi:hypothetical protein
MRHILQTATDTRTSQEAIILSRTQAHNQALTHTHTHTFVETKTEVQKRETLTPNENRCSKAQGMSSAAGSTQTERGKAQP